MKREALACAILAVFSLCLCGTPAWSEDLSFFEEGTRPATLQFNAGAFALYDDRQRDTVALLQLDAVSSWAIVKFKNYFQINPYVGGFATGQGSLMGYPNWATLRA